jgi:hypothetical protein
LFSDKTLSLKSSSSNANVQFVPDNILIPGLNIDVATTPTNTGIVASVTLQSNVTFGSATLDASLWLIKSILDLSPLPTGCIVSNDQLVLLAFRTAPILENSVRLGFEGGLSSALSEFNRVLPEYGEKAAEILLIDMPLGCASDKLKEIFKKPFVLLKIGYEYGAWLATILFDYLQYQGGSFVTLSYVPPIPPTPTPISTAIPSPKPLALKGRWEGSVNQPGAVYYTTILTLTGCDIPNAICGSVEYPELSCGGKITFLSEKIGVYYLRENITYGTKCAKEVNIELTHISGNSWKAIYHYESLKGSGTAEANLTKTK